MEIKDKVVIVTGGASGIGAALGKAFLEAGAKAVVAVDLKTDGAPVMRRKPRSRHHSAGESG